MFRQVARTTRVGAVSRGVLIRSRPFIPLVTRARFSSQQYYYEEPEPSKAVRYLLAITAAAGAIWFVKPYKPKPKKVEKEEKKVEDPLARFEPPMETEILVEDEPVVEETITEEAVIEEPTETSPAEVVPTETDSAAPAVSTEQSTDTTDSAVLDSQVIAKASEPKKDGSKDKAKTDLAGKEGQKMENLEEETKRESAYNPDTGEINWDCPCLGGMADGPCGEEFKLAFSCFIYSEAEPKGIDCVEKFQGMQTCFRKYPEYYAEQLKDEEEADAIMNAEGATNTNENGEIVLDETVTIEEPAITGTSDIVSETPEVTATVTETIETVNDKLDDPFEEIELTESE